MLLAGMECQVGWYVQTTVTDGDTFANRFLGRTMLGKDGAKVNPEKRENPLVREARKKGFQMDACPWLAGFNEPRSVAVNFSSVQSRGVTF